MISQVIAQQVIFQMTGLKVHWILQIWQYVSNIKTRTLTEEIKTGEKVLWIERSKIKSLAIYPWTSISNIITQAISFQVNSTSVKCLQPFNSLLHSTQKSDLLALLGFWNRGMK